MPAQKIFNTPIDSSCREQGFALIEYAIVFPLLVLLLIGLVEISNMLMVYASVSAVSDEALRMLEATPELPSMTDYWSKPSSVMLGSSSSSPVDPGYISPDEINTCVASPNRTDLPCGHALAHYRVRNLLERFLKVRFVNLDDLRIDSQYFPASSGSGNESDTVKVSVEVAYRGLFSFFGDFKIRSTTQGVYLFNQ